MDRLYRKLQKLGGSLVISLPKNWTKNYDLKAGSSLPIELRDDGTLTISPKTENPDKIIGDEVVLEADIRRYVNRLPNTEIIEETKHKITIQNFGYKEIPTKKLIKRLLDLVANMFEDLRNDSLDELQYNFEDLRKFYFILVIHIRTYLRTGIYISSNSDFTPLEAMDYRMLCEKNQEIGEILEKFGLSEGILDFYKETEQYFNEIREAFLKKDDKLAYYSWLKKDGLFKKAIGIMENLEHDERDNINILLRIVQNCKDMAALI